MTEEDLFKSAMENAIIKSSEIGQYMIDNMESILKRTLTEDEELILLYGFGSGITFEVFKRLKNDPAHKYN